MRSTSVGNFAFVADMHEKGILFGTSISAQTSPTPWPLPSAYQAGSLAILVCYSEP